MPRLIILRDNSGSGKSSVAKSLQREIGRNTLLISQDTVRREMLPEEMSLAETVQKILSDLQLKN